MTAAGEGIKKVLKRHGVVLTADAFTKLMSLRSVRAFQRAVARSVITAKGGVEVEKMRELCKELRKELRCYDSAHFKGYMAGFGQATEDGRVTHWIG